MPLLRCEACFTVEALTLRACHQAAVATASALISSGAISPDAISSYLHATAGFVFDADVPDFVVKYFHGINMATGALRHAFSAARGN